MILFYLPCSFNSIFTVLKFQFHYDLILFQLHLRLTFAQYMDFNFIMILFYLIPSVECFGYPIKFQFHYDLILLHNLQVLQVLQILISISL